MQSRHSFGRGESRTRTIGSTIQARSSAITHWLRAEWWRVDIDQRSGSDLHLYGGINKAGVVAGYSFDASHNSHGFTWNKGTITTIDYGNGYPNTYLAGINDSGVIVGGYGTNETIASIFYPWEHGFLYSSGTFSTFDAPFGDVQVTQPRGMNNKGEIVGGYVDGQGMLCGFYAKATP